MPAPREQPSPPGGKNRRRPDVMPGGWLWLVLLILLVLVLLVTLGFPNASVISYSEFQEIARAGQKFKDNAEDKNAQIPRNTWIQKVTFYGDERLEGELV